MRSARADVDGGGILLRRRDPFTRKVIIDRGSSQGIEEGPPWWTTPGSSAGHTHVSVDFGISLISDREQVVPVQVVRNGLRAAVFGIGYDGALDLRFMPVNTDVENGDVLVTSGSTASTRRTAGRDRVEHRAQRRLSFRQDHLYPGGRTNRNRQVLVMFQAGAAARLSGLAEQKGKARKARKSG